MYFDHEFEEGFFTNIELKDGDVLVIGLICRDEKNNIEMNKLITTICKRGGGGGGGGHILLQRDFNQ